MQLNRSLIVRRRDLYALTISLALTATLVSCGGAPDTPAPGGDTLGAAGQGQIGGGAPPGVGGAAASAGAAPANAGGNVANTGGTPANVGGATSSTGGTSSRPPSSGAPSCPTYDDDFLPKVYTPICSTCHNSTARVPNWGVYATAKASCSLIGSRVASGAMPPRSSSPLSADQKSLVADWVRLGCPQTMAELPASCFPPPTPPTPGGAGGAPPSTGAGGAPPSTGMGGAGGTAPSAGGAGGTATTPPAVGTVTITRAEWDASKQTLRLEGTSSDTSAMLTAEFGGRSVMLMNQGGRFRVELTGVTTNPSTVTVRSSKGAVASANVQAN
jgi:hypothetical protein